MRHAAPPARSNRKLNRAGQIVFAGIVYVSAGLATGLIALGATATIWVLWQQLGVN